MIDRMAHEIAERQKDLPDLAFIGIRTRGVPLATRLAKRLGELVGRPFPVGTLDITLYRDDLSMVAPQPLLKKTEIDFDLNGRTVLLCDDVLYTGRTIRAALDGVIDLGRPRAMRLAVLIDRGHRELPIEANYVGKSVPTAGREVIKVMFQETDGTDEVWILEKTGVTGNGAGRSAPGRRGVFPSPSLPARARCRPLPSAPQRPPRHRDPFARRDHAHPRHGGVHALDRRAADQEGPGAARPDGRQPLLRGLDAHALLLRDGGEVAVGRLAELRRQGQLRREGRVAARHGPQPSGDGAGPDRHPARHPGRAALPGPPPPGGGRERGRRRPRAPDAGAARRADDPPALRPARGSPRRDRRRPRALARRALEHLAADEDGRARRRLRAADAPAAAHRGDGRRGDDGLRRSSRGRGRRHDAAHAARAAGRVALPVLARVLQALRPDGRRGSRRAARTPS